MQHSGASLYTYIDIPVKQVNLYTGVTPGLPIKVFFPPRDIIQVTRTIHLAPAVLNRVFPIYITILLE